MLEPTMPNLPMLRKVLAHIDEHPEEWNQESWGTRTPCGTAFCIAGHVAHMAGADILWRETGIVSGGNYVADEVLVDGVSISIEEFAVKELRLPEDYESTWAHRLFNPANSRAAIQHIAEQIAEDAGEEL